METFVFFLIVGLLLLTGVIVSVRLHAPDGFVTGRIRHIRRLRRVRPVVPGAVNALPASEVIEEIIDEVEPVAPVEEEV
jgi:hypothetical protein